MERFKYILSQISAGEVKEVDEDSDPNYWEIKELRDAGYVTGNGWTDDDGSFYRDIRITLSGRSFMAP